MTVLDQITAESIDNLPDRRILELAADYLRESTPESAQVDDDDRAILALMNAGAVAATSDRAEDHRAVTAALVGLGRAVFRKELGRRSRSAS